ncbi:MAG: PQQ-binding-like beta-propeller repeat protein [Planctomycetota bacterium]
MENEVKRNSFNRPKWSLVWTFFAALGVGFLRFGSDWLNESAEIQPGIINLMTMLLVFVTAMVWFFWLAFFSGHRARYLIALVFVSLISLFFYRFRLIFDGDLGFVRVESRFLKREFARSPVSDLNQTAINLALESDKDFRQFLGNERDSVVRNRVLNGNWKENPPEVLWRQPIGEGWSGFSAVNGFAVTQEQNGQDECVTCYDAKTGKLLWIHSAPRRHEDTMAMGKAGPRATPTIENGRIYAQGATGVLECLNGSDGTVIWTTDITELLGTELTEMTTSTGYKYEFENSHLAWGRSGSPLVVGNKLIVPGGLCADGSCSTLIALDKTTGKELWRGGDVMIAYGSPSLETLAGKEQIVIVAENCAMGIAPEDGTTLWKVERLGHSGQDANCSQVTIVDENHILLSKGYGLGGQLVRLEREGETITPTTLWKSPRILKTKMMSPVVLNGHTYSLSDGFLECTTVGGENEEGRRVWRVRGRFGNGQLLLVGDNLLIHTEFGELKLVRATPEKYIELGSIETIEGVCWNTICLYDNLLLVRSELEAACIELKTEVQTATPAEPESSMDNPEQNSALQEEPVHSSQVTENSNTDQQDDE